MVTTSLTFIKNVHGCILHVNPGDARGVKLIESKGNVNPSAMTLWNRALAMEDWDVVVDVGSNYGEMLLSADLPSRARLVAFEPSPSVLPYLRRTLNEWDRPVELIESAVSAEPAVAADFLRDAECSANSVLAAAGMGSANAIHESVPVTTLDAELAGQGIASACIKVDVEGAEEAVLAGAKTFLSGLQRWVIMLEILHLSPEAVARLVREHPLYLQDRRTGDLVRVLNENPVVVRALLESRWLYPQDAILASSADVVER